MQQPRLFLLYNLSPGLAHAKANPTILFLLSATRSLYFARRCPDLASANANVLQLQLLLLLLPASFEDKQAQAASEAAIEAVRCDPRSRKDVGR